jgi:hypothetical protein
MYQHAMPTGSEQAFHRGWFAIVAASTWLLIGSSHAAVPPCDALKPVASQLEANRIKFSVLGDEGETIKVTFTTKQYRDLEGDNSLAMYLVPAAGAGRKWLEIACLDLYSFEHCEHPSVARAVLLGAPGELESIAHYEVDGSDDTAMLRVRIPLPQDDSDPNELRLALKEVVNDVEALAPVMRRAMASGLVCWPSEDAGPSAPLRLVPSPAGDGPAERSGWAPWTESEAYASTLVCAREFLGDFFQWNQDGRDAFGRALTNGFKESTARTIYARWRERSSSLASHPTPGAIRVWAPEGTKVVSSVCVDGLTRTAGRMTLQVDASGVLDIFPQAEWITAELLKLEQPTDVTAHLGVQIGDFADEVDVPLRLHPASVAEMAFPGTFTVAMYADEMHPWVKDIITEASRLRIAPTLGASAETGRDDAARQVFAIWSAFRSRDLSYVSLAGASDGKRSQRMRQIHESITDSGANCADGTAAFAAVLLALGFDVHICETSGHVFLALDFNGDDSDHDWLFVETTMLGSDAAPPTDSAIHSVEATLPERWRGNEWNVFECAVESADAQAKKACLDSDFSIQSMGLLRRAGIRAMPAFSAGLGTMPPPPDRGPIEQRRSAAAAAVKAEVDELNAWTASLPNKDPVPYPTVEAAIKDLETALEDPTAIGRLLRAVDGDDPALRAMRAHAFIEDAIVPFRRAATKKFGAPNPYSGAALKLPPTILRVEDGAGESDRHYLLVYDGDDDAAAGFGVHPVAGGYCIDGEFLSRKSSELVDSSFKVLRAFDPALLRSKELLAAISEQLVNEISAGSIADHHAAIDRFIKLLSSARPPAVDPDK